MKTPPEIDNFNLLERIREFLNLSVEEFCREMNWPAVSYYDAIKTGFRRDGRNKKRSCPTISKVFDGINWAIFHYPHWKQHNEAIQKICLEELFPNFGDLEKK